MGCGRPTLRGHLASIRGTSRTGVSDGYRPRCTPTIAKTLRVSLDWLVTGKEPPGSANVAPGPNPRAAVPLVSWVQAGDWTECADPSPPGMADEWVSSSMRVSPRAFALKVRGDSMAPEFSEGATLIIDPAVEPVDGSYVIVRLEDSDSASFKQLVIDGPQKFLKPLNPRYPVISINGNATMVGVVVEQRKEYWR